MKKLLTLVLTAAATLSLTTCTFAQAEPPPDPLSRMVAAATAGNMAAGKAAEADRAASAPDGIPVSFDELCLLSKYIAAKAGNAQLSDEFLFFTGEVALNRVVSPEFPDTLSEVVAQELPYAAALSGPSSRRLPRSCVEAAMRLLLGERRMESSVVYQTDRREGDIYAIFGDKLLGFTYFCRSPHPELYAAAEEAEDLDA